MQDREVLEDDTIALNLQGIQSGVINFGLPFTVVLLSKISKTANPPLLPGLKNIDYVHKRIMENDALFHLLGKCLQKESFLDIQSLEILQPTLERMQSSVVRPQGVSRPSIGQQFVEAKYVSHPLATFKLYMNQCFQRFLSPREDNKLYYGLYISVDCSELSSVEMMYLWTDKGFPPWDDIPANLLADKKANNSREYKSRCSAFFVPVFQTLESTIQEICTTKCDGWGQITFLQCMEGWQHEFSSFMPRYTIHTLEMRNISLSDNSVDRKSMALGSGCRPAKDTGLAFSGKEVMMDAYKSLVHVIKGLLPKATASGTDPEMNVMLGFDEASILRDKQGWPPKFIPVDIICRAISIYSTGARYPIWAIFASTNS
ncbi:hypothetical protein BU17DRAFT_66237 [Hysterangium stoloniferum]|nr:hypothetical protein BU17DRAFT_66237 [Hysterangium stoloniferum]